MDISLHHNSYCTTTMMVQRTRIRRLVLLWLVLVVAAMAQQQEGQDSSARAEGSAEEASDAGTSADFADGGGGDPTTQGSTEEEEEPKKKKEKESVKQDDDFDVTNEDWGSYYDPQNVFCGKYDCYKILGFDYESFGKVKPSKKEITQRYRKLSKEWHPDKSKHRHAKARFVKIARAYETLTSKELRAEYDYMRYDQDAYFDKYGANVLWSYAPKTDTALVLLLLFVVGNIFSWYSQKHRWSLVADRLIKAAVEDWAPRDGGTPESKQLREDALAILMEKEEATENNENGAATSSTPSKASGKKKSGKKDKLPAKERKRQEQEALQPIITKLVNAMDDFGGGFHKPTYKDLLIVTMVKLPYKIATGLAWQSKYWARRLQKKELNDEEREVLTQRAVGPVTWSASSDEDRLDMVKRELWIKDNFLEWQEEQEIKTLSAAEQKQYYKLKKKGKLDKLE